MIQCESGWIGLEKERLLLGVAYKVAIGSNGETVPQVQSASRLYSLYVPTYGRQGIG